jgi:ribosome-binding factor A
MRRDKTSPTASQRQLRVGEALRHALAEVFMEGAFYDQDLGTSSITVSEVRVSPDLRNATVFVMPLGGTDDPKKFLGALKRLTPVLRARATKLVNLKFSPELAFRIDDSFTNATHIEKLLQSVLPPETDATSESERVDD